MFLKPRVHQENSISSNQFTAEADSQRTSLRLRVAMDTTPRSMPIRNSLSKLVFIPGKMDAFDCFGIENIGFTANEA